MERKPSRAAIGIIAVLGASIATSTVAGAQTTPLMCGGLEATIIVDDDSPYRALGTDGDDVILGGPGIDDLDGNRGNDELVVVGPDIGHGGFGTDACINGALAETNTVACETSEPAGPEWDDIW